MQGECSTVRTLAVSESYQNACEGCLHKEKATDGQRNLSAQDHPILSFSVGRHSLKPKFYPTLMIFILSSM